MTRPSLSLFLAVFIALAPTTTFAQPETEAAGATNPNTEKARVLFQEGNAAYRERNWQLAYDKFHEAFGLAPTYDLAGNLGDVELMEKPRDAAGTPYSLKNGLRDRPRRVRKRKPA
jgi:hypothetical protein